MRKYLLREVNQWTLQEESSNETARVYLADIEHGLFYKVEETGKRPKYFYGETAWQDANRYADDRHVRNYTQ